MKKNLFLTFCFSFIPGAGQMYQQFMKRGLSIMLIFVGLVMLSILVNTPIFAVFIPVIVAYSFFDTYKIRNDIEKNIQIQDKYIWDGLKLSNDKKDSNKNIKKYIGIILIIFGIYMIFNNFLVDILNSIDNSYINEVIKTIDRYFTTILVSVISIFIGIKFILKKGE